jgi:hypothetical protein
MRLVPAFVFAESICEILAWVFGLRKFSAVATTIDGCVKRYPVAVPGHRNREFHFFLPKQFTVGTVCL